jgi:hypothetical protein
MTQRTDLEAKNIGARFRSARSLVPHLNRKSFCERHEINRYTMQSWENGLHVSKGKNVEKFTQALAREGIACTAEWLIDGVGEPARPFNAVSVESCFPETPDLSKEALTSLITLHIQDQAMEPQFRVGDQVLGLDISHDLKRAHQKLVIVKLSEQRQVLRKAIVFKDHLILLANDSRVPTFSLSLPATIYEIVWHRINQ